MAANYRPPEEEQQVRDDEDDEGSTLLQAREDSKVNSNVYAEIISSKPLSLTRALDALAWLASPLPSLVFLGLVGASDIRAATWASFGSACFLIAVDYFRLRLRRGLPIRVPDCLHCFSLLAALSLGIANETAASSIAKRVYGPTYVSVLELGFLLVLLFDDEHFPLHGLDREGPAIKLTAFRRTALSEITGKNAHISRRLCLVWVLAFFPVVCCAWIGIAYEFGSAANLALSIIIPSVTTGLLSLCTPLLVWIMLEGSHNVEV
jgi:hypothetical protein